MTNNTQTIKQKKIKQTSKMSDTELKSSKHANENDKNKKKQANMR
jgi:hypothetical protein